MAANCPKCELVAETTQKTIKCALCENVFHAACAGINIKSHEVLNKLKNVRWFCDLCDGANLIDELKQFRDFRSQHAKLSEEMAAQSNRLLSLEQKLEAWPSNQQPQPANMLTRSDVASIFRNEVELDKRKNNLCVFGFVPGANDKLKFIEMCQEQLGLQAEDLNRHVVEAVRVGNEPRHGNANNSPTRPRPLIVKLSSFSYKIEILKNASKLKNFRPPNSNLKVFIANDLTKEQQIDLKNLRSELSRRREMGDDVIIVRGAIVVRERSSGNSAPTPGTSAHSPETPPRHNSAPSSAARQHGSDNSSNNGQSRNLRSRQ